MINKYLRFGSDDNMIRLLVNIDKQIVDIQYRSPEIQMIIGNIGDSITRSALNGHQMDNTSLNNIVDESVQVDIH